MSDEGAAGVHKLILKIFLCPPSALRVTDLIPVFHRFIQEGTLPGLWIDVADYSHVPKGPGVMLIGHEGDLGLDFARGEPGLMYAQKRPSGGSFEERLRHNLKQLLEVGILLENEPALVPSFCFSSKRIELRFNDRLLAPNDPGTKSDVLPKIEAFGRLVFGAGASVFVQATAPKELFGVTLSAAAEVPLVDLVSRLG